MELRACFALQNSGGKFGQITYVARFTRSISHEPHLFFIFFHKLTNPAFRIKQLLLAAEKRMAF